MVGLAVAAAPTRVEACQDERAIRYRNDRSLALIFVDAKFIMIIFHIPA
jgi:hypothetical protein